VIDAAGAAPATPTPARDNGIDGEGVIVLGGEAMALVDITDGGASSEPAGTVDGGPASSVGDGVPATVDDGVPAIGSDDSDVVDEAAVVPEGAPATGLADVSCDVDVDIVVEIDGCAAPAGRIQLGTTIVFDCDCPVD
jgi:hypothetical protein